MKTARHSLARRAAFTLMEMLIALSAFVLLMGGIFAIANGTMELGSDMTLVQDRSIIRQNFISFLRRSFRTLPGEAEVRLAVQARGSLYLPSLNFVNGGSSFTPGTALPPDTSVDLFAEEMPGGYLRVGLRVLDDRQTAALRSNQTVRYSRDNPVIPLLENVSRFEWRFYDAASNRWENNWKQARRPMLAELNLKLDDGFETRAVFWVPPVIPNPVLGNGMGIPNPNPVPNPNPNPGENPNPDNPNPNPGGGQPLPQQ